MINIKFGSLTTGIFEKILVISVNERNMKNCFNRGYQMKNLILSLSLTFLFVGYSAEVFAYTCPKGHVPVINQAGKQSGCRKA